MSERDRLNIKDLRDGMRTVDVEGEVIEVSAPRDVSLRAGGMAKVADARLKDKTGTVKVSLWNEQIDEVNRGAIVKITNGFTNNFRGEVQLNIGRYGKLQVLEAA